MRLRLTIITLFFLTLQIAFGQNEKQDPKRFSTDSISGVYIPKDLDDCFRQIDGLWSDSTKMKVKLQSEDYFATNAHFGLGLWTRNNWQLWGGSRLSKYFNDMGIDHPDDMSGIILKSYHRYLTGKDINLNQQIEYKNDYWKAANDPSKDIFPKGEKNMEFKIKMPYRLKKGDILSCLHIQSNSITDKVWVYDYHFGWKQLSQEELKKLRSTTSENREESIIRLFAK